MNSSGSNGSCEPAPGCARCTAIERRVVEGVKTVEDSRGDRIPLVPGLWPGFPARRYHRGSASISILLTIRNLTAGRACPASRSQAEPGNESDTNGPDEGNGPNYLRAIHAPRFPGDAGLHSVSRPG